MMSDQQIENAAKAMIAEGLRCGDCMGEEEPSDCTFCLVAGRQSARAAAPHLTKDLEDTVDALRGRVKELLDELEIWPMRQRLGKAEAEVTRLKSALEKYGRHRAGCRINEYGPGIHSPEHSCTCGFDAALAQARGTE